MKCKGKNFTIKGLEATPMGIKETKFHVIVTNDQIGKTMSINNGTVQFSIPMDELSKYLN